MTGPAEQPVVEASAWIRKQLLDQARRWADAFVIAMRAEGVSDETAARVLNRITLGVPDPDQVITPVEPRVDAMLAVLHDEGAQLPYGPAQVDLHLSPDSEGEERARQLAALRAADEEADGKNREVVRRALLAADGVSTSASVRHLCGDAQKLDPWGQHGGPTCP